MPHSLGHGIGLAAHETPFLRNRKNSETELKSGMVVTIEPGLYEPGKRRGAPRERFSHYPRRCGSPHQLPDLYSSVSGYIAYHSFRVICRETYS